MRQPKLYGRVRIRHSAASKASIPMNLVPGKGSLLDSANLRDSTSVTSKGSEPRNVEKLPAKTCGGSWFPKNRHVVKLHLNPHEFKRIRFGMPPGAWLYEIYILLNWLDRSKWPQIVPPRSFRECDLPAVCLLMCPGTSVEGKRRVFLSVTTLGAAFLAFQFWRVFFQMGIWPASSKS